MCGRFSRSNDFFSQHANQREFLNELGLSWAELLPPSFNIAPTQEIAAVRANDRDSHELVMLRWGLVPGWADDLSIGNRMINARAETIADKPAFKRIFRKQRCLILADGFYEWRKDGPKKQPFFIRFKDRRPFCFAGLWDRWSKVQPSVESCTIITTEANELMAPLHDRMPVIVAPENYNLWLDHAVQEPERLLPLLRPFASEPLEAFPVSSVVNSPRHNAPDCVAPLPGPTAENRAQGRLDF